MYPARILTKACVVLLLSACVASPPPTPELTPPAGLALIAASERDRIRITLELDQNPMAAGEEAWITTRLQNLATTDLFWVHDGCTFTMWVTADSATPWRAGVGQAGNAAAFKAKALEDSGPGASRARLVFMPEDYLHAGSTHFGCPQNRVLTKVVPGGGIEQRARWDGELDGGFGAPSPGPFEIAGMIRGTFSRDADGETAVGGPIDVRLSAWVAGGRDPTLLQPPEAIDAALGNATFLEYLTDPRLSRPYNARVRYDDSADRWLVGLVNGDTLLGRAVTIDPIDGAILEVADGRWDSLAYRSP